MSWSGSDDPGGSGIATYDVYVSDNGGSFQPWLTGATNTSATFTGQYGHTYGFYSVATDNVGNQEATPTAAEATTLVASHLPTTTLVASDHPTGLLYGQTVTLTATVSPVALGSATPLGTVTFLDGTVTLGLGIWNPTAGDFTYSTSTLTLGSHAITARFAPTDPTTFYASTASLTQVVGQIATTTKIAASPSPAAVGQTVTFTVAVAAVDPSLGPASGTVTVKDGSTVLGTGLLGANGTFHCSASFTKAGSHTIVASFVPAVVRTKAPTTNFLASTATLTQMVSRSAVGVTIQVSPSSAPRRSARRSLSRLPFARPIPRSPPRPPGR